ncbi:MAG: polysaccharide deacetylase family protein [Lachnospiraceae bacterium]|nr:polysaccharide deacetylase family protein [Lachnospiraceae bacterium]
MNIISFDTEEWFLEKKNHGGRDFKYKEFDIYLGKILDQLDANNMKATFFCLGKVATDFPYVIRQIAERGHEVGCHSNEHLWLNKLNIQQLRKDTHDAVSAIENVIGQKVLSYRAPAFSIGEWNKWALDILVEEGITRDSSIFPATRDFGGFSSFLSKTPAIIKYNGIEIKEFPICTTKLFGKEIAYSGGGYFRLLPLWFVKNTMAKSDYNITYFHIADLIQNKNGMMSSTHHEKYYLEPGTHVNRLKRYVKSNLGTGKAFSKMCNLMPLFDFTSLEEADKQIDWNKVKTIEVK